MSRPAEMLPLFPLQPEQGYRDESSRFAIAWSHSRRTLLERCPRHYYYEYYGANARSGVDDPCKATLRFLKNLRNRYIRAGQILHAAIARFFRLAQDGEVWTSQRLESWATRLLDRDVAYSKLHPNGQESSVEGQPESVLLLEFYYRQRDAEALYSDIRTRLIRSLRTFMNHDAFAWCRMAGADPRTLIEAAISIPGFPCRLEGRVDLAYCGEDGVNIVDWKIGDADGGGESLQLVTYGLWACTEFKCSAERVHIYKAYLGSGRLVAYELAEWSLQAARARILQDATRMQFLHRYGQDAVADAFTPCAQRGICALCPYQGICPVGRYFQHA